MHLVFFLKMWTSVPMIKVNASNVAAIQLEVMFAIVYQGSPWWIDIFA